MSVRTWLHLPRLAALIVAAVAISTFGVAAPAASAAVPARITGTVTGLQTDPGARRVAPVRGRGRLAPAGVSLGYQWLRNGQPIAGATAGTYVPRLRDVLSRLSVRVTGSLTGADPVTLVSERTARVRLR